MTVAEARFLLKPSDVDYGPTCPECASPKHRQSKRCKDCYYDARRRGEYPDPPVLHGAEKPNWKGGVSLPKGTPRGRPQPQSHPWRGKNALLFMTRNTQAALPPPGSDAA